MIRGQNKIHFLFNEEEVNDEETSNLPSPERQRTDEILRKNKLAKISLMTDISKEKLFSKKLHVTLDVC